MAVPPNPHREPGSLLIDGRAPDGNELLGRVRDGRYTAGTVDLAAGDLLMLRTDLPTLEQLVGSGLVAATPMLEGIEVQRIEAVVMPESIFVGSRVLDLEPLFERDIRVDGLSIANVAPELSLDEQRLRVGDILVLRGEPAVLEEELHECGLTPILPSPVPAAKPNWLPVAVFALGVALTAVAGLRAEIAFGLVVVVLALTGDLSLRRGLETMNWPILIMLGAMIPLGEAVATTGLADGFAQAATSFLPTASAPAVIGAMLALSILLTPFVNNPSTVLVLAPVGIELAGQYGVAPEPVVIAITIGASLDFITPFGHHNNTLVMGIANYRFTDFLRYGLPLLILTSLAAFLIVSLIFVR
jgi:di/tricarboxylate transporter